MRNTLNATINGNFKEFEKIIIYNFAQQTKAKCIDWAYIASVLPTISEVTSVKGKDFAVFAALCVASIINELKPKDELLRLKTIPLFVELYKQLKIDNTWMAIKSNELQTNMVSALTLDDTEFEIDSVLETLNTLINFELSDTEIIDSICRLGKVTELELEEEIYNIGTYFLMYTLYAIYPESVSWFFTVSEASIGLYVYIPWSFYDDGSKWEDINSDMSIFEFGFREISAVS